MVSISNGGLKGAMVCRVRTPTQSGSVSRGSRPLLWGACAIWWSSLELHVPS